MLFWVILATVVDVLATISTVVSRGLFDESAAHPIASFFGGLIGLGLRALPVIMMWVLYCR